LLLLETPVPAVFVAEEFDVVAADAVRPVVDSAF
jgi:hypothetical protein